MVLECVCPAVILKGEVVMAPKELAAYFGTPEKPECHMLYNVSTMVNLWGALASRDTRLLKAQLDALHALPGNCWFVNYLRCHDDIGWGLDEAAENRLDIDPQKHKEYLKGFDYHCGHNFKTYSDICTSIFGAGGAAISAEALRRFSDTYGEDMADVLVSYKNTDFNLV